MNWTLLALILTGLTLGAVALVRFVRAYKAATGTRWQRILAVFRNSETILLARLQVLAGAFLALCEGGANFLQQPEISDALRQLFKPEWIPLYVIGLGLITELVRRHRSAPDPVSGAITDPPKA